MRLIRHDLITDRDVLERPRQYVFSSKLMEFVDLDITNLKLVFI